MPIQRLTLLSVHTSPLASLGHKKTGGMNVYVRELAQELGRRGIAVDNYTRRTSAEQPEIDRSLGENVQVVHVVAGPGQPLEPGDIFPYLSQFTAGVIAFCTKHGLRYDLIYSHYWLSGWVANKLKEAWGTPFVHMFHTLGHMKNRIQTAQPVFDLRTDVETQIIRCAERIIAATPAEQAQLLWLYRADRRKIAIVPPGVNVERFQPIDTTEAKRVLGIPAERELLLFVGRIEPLKGVDTIFQALDWIRGYEPELLQRFSLAIIGGDPEDLADLELSRLRVLSKQLGLGNVVQFLGAKDHTLLPYYYAAAAAVVMPSDYESFGLVALEAMASGTPVIASEVGGLAFLVRDGETGFLVPVREPEMLARRIITVLTDPAERQRMGRQAAEAAQPYAWPVIANALLAIFQEVVSGRSTAQFSRRKR